MSDDLKPTMELRWYSRCEDELELDRQETLQQLWRDENGNEEWKDIPRIFK